MSRRVFALALACTIMFAVLIGRLVGLQWLRGPQLAAAGLAQRTRSLVIAPGRGAIYDRNGLPLSDPQLSLDLVLFPGGKVDEREATTLLVDAFGLAAADIAAALAGTSPVVLKANVSESEARRVADVARHVPGLLLVPRDVRPGPGALATHVLGEMHVATGDGAGIEAGLDRYLRGSEPLAVSAFVDGNNRLIPGLGYRLHETASGHGFDVYLTISAAWQAATEAALAAAGGAGAAVVVDVASGDILAMASTPEPPESYLNRAVLAYAPGSLFKVVVLAAALSEGIVALADTWPAAEQDISVQQAFAASDNSVFQALGKTLGAERLLHYASVFHLGQRHEVGLPGEQPGQLPAADAVAPGDLHQLSIGQGPLTLTPLQAAALLAAVGNDGNLPALQLIREVRNDAGVVVWRPPQQTDTRVVSSAVAAQLQQALGHVVTDGSGTRAAVPGLWTGGKTGTAEAFSPATGEPVLHAWFGGLADLPPALGARRLAIVVFLESGDSGGSDAAPVFADILHRALPLSLSGTQVSE